jgi:hypothetical protein
LVSYGADYVNHFRQAASYVARILRGEKAGDLPVQQPSKFQLIVNIKTAKALGLDVPAEVLATADEVDRIAASNAASAHGRLWHKAAERACAGMSGGAGEC